MPEAGGAAVFPGVNDEACGTAVHVPPLPHLAGSAVLFFNTVEKPGCDDYETAMFLITDSRMGHAGLPVERGEKWMCHRWVHPIAFGAGVRGLSSSAEYLVDATRTIVQLLVREAH